MRVKIFHIRRFKYSKIVKFYKREIYIIYMIAVSRSMSDEKTQAEKDIFDTNQEVTKQEKTEMLSGAEATTK
jgi:hypothetical protein